MADAEQLHDEENEDQIDEEDDEEFDKPLVPHKVYDSPYQEETVTEIKNFRITSRPLIKMQFIKKRRDFGQPFKLNDTEASEKQAEIRAVNDPFMHTVNKVIDIGLQGCNPLVSAATQTTWNRKINKAIEIKDTDLTQEVEDENTELQSFLETVYPRMEEALQSNETIDIYQNDFDLFAGEEAKANEGGGLSTTFKEFQSFMSMQCKGKKISCIQFQPNPRPDRPRYIAASFIENLTFEERIVYNCKSHKNIIGLWDYDDLHSTEPVLILTAPLEILCFAFNPKDSEIIVGGAINGQILMWDLKQNSALSALQGKKGKNQKKESSQIPELPPVIMSALQDPSSVSSANMDVVRKNVQSHRNPVLALQWLPDNIEIDRKNIFHHHPPQPANELHQFASISCDGQVLIWDNRFGDPKDKNKPVQDLSTVIWKATYAIQLFRPDGGGQMGGAQIAFKRKQKVTTFTVTSDEGEVAVVDWAVRPKEEDRKADMVQYLWQNERNFRPTVALDLSPFFDDIILTLYDFYFCIWKHNISVPIFESSVLKETQITCGCFSPSRPGVIIIGKSNGFIEIWDLIDQSHKFTIQYQVVAKPLSYIRFNEDVKGSSLGSQLAVGDTEGVVHIIELPSTLARPQGDEVTSMGEFFKREVDRVDYFAQRFAAREELFKKEKMDREKQESLEEAKAQSKEEGEKKDAEDEALEQEYQEFAKNYIKEVINKEPPKEKEEKKKGN